MGLGEKVRRFFERWRHLQEQREESEAESSAVADVAPEIADAILALRVQVAKTSYAAVEAANDALTPFRDDLVEVLHDALRALDAHQAKSLSDLTDECVGLLEASHDEIESQSGQLASLRDVFTEQQSRTKRLEEGYDWKIIKQFCFRFIRILDSLAEQIDALPADAAETHRRDLRDLYAEIQFALEASGVEQFRPEDKSSFIGHEKRLKVVGKVPSQDVEDRGLVARVLMPGYVLIEEGLPDRVLRPAHIDIYEVSQLQETAS
jgi:molecular chaperone GrpE (heat shock protein)